MTATPQRTDPIALDDRTRRVLELRRAIIEGAYKIDAEAVATAVLREWAANANDARDDRAEGPPATMEAMARFVIRPGNVPEPASERPGERSILVA